MIPRLSLLVALAVACAAAPNLLSVLDPVSSAPRYVVDAEGFALRPDDPVARLDAVYASLGVSVYAAAHRDAAGQLASGAPRVALYQRSLLRGASVIEPESVLPGIGAAEIVARASSHNLHGRQALVVCARGDGRCGVAVYAFAPNETRASRASGWTFSRPEAEAGAWTLDQVAYSPAKNAVLGVWTSASGAKRAFRSTPAATEATLATVASAWAAGSLWIADASDGATRLQVSGARSVAWPSILDAGAYSAVLSAPRVGCSDGASLCFAASGDAGLAGATIAWSASLAAPAVAGGSPVPCNVAAGVAGSYAYAGGDGIVARTPGGAPAATSHGAALASYDGIASGLCATVSPSLSLAFV